VIYIDDLLIDELNEAKMSSHAVGAYEVLEILVEDKFEAFSNPSHRSGGAPYVLVGPTAAGRFLTVPIDPTPLEGVWRPRTAYDSGKQQLIVIAALVRNYEARLIYDD